MKNAINWVAKILIITVLVLLIAAYSAAEGVRITGGGWSTHLAGQGIVNEEHEHWALQYRRVEIGTFRNSFDEEAWYGAYEINKRFKHLEGFAKIGAVYGYRGILKQKGERQWLPMVAPGVRFTKWALQPEVTVVVGAVSLGVSLEL